MKKTVVKTTGDNRIAAQIQTSFIVLAVMISMIFCLASCASGGSDGSALQNSSAEESGSALENSGSEESGSTAGDPESGSTSNDGNAAGTADGNGAPAGADNGGKSHRIRVVASIFPEYDWAKCIIGDDNDNVDLMILADNGTDIHSFQPSAKNILQIATCDVFIHVGGESDVWLEDVLRQADNPDMIIVDLMETLGEKKKAEETKEGMIPIGGDQEHYHHHDHDGHHHHDDGDAPNEKSGEKHHEDNDHHDAEEIEYDEHVWLSLRNASIVCEEITEAMVKADPEHEEKYRKNLKDYTAKLDALDEKYKEVVRKSPKDVLLFGDRFPFLYLTEDYGLDYYAAFEGCSAETEASFETITFLADKVDELGLNYVLKVDGSDGRIADTIIQNTRTKDQKVLELDSMQQITRNQLDAGASYLGTMEKNCMQIQKALR